jgi:hypothetical protein
MTRALIGMVVLAALVAAGVYVGLAVLLSLQHYIPSVLR